MNLVRLSFGVLLFLFSSLAPIYAQSAGNSSATAVAPGMPEIYPQPSESSGFFGEQHKYSVTFRGNGEAVVALHVVFTNTEDFPVTTASLRLPTPNTPTELSAFQVIRQGRCINYGGKPTPLLMEPSTDPSLSIAPYDRNCTQFQEPNYYEYWYGDTQYQKAEARVETDTIRVALPRAISPNKSGSYVVYFRSRGYVNKDLIGAFTGSFETLKSNQIIRTVQVGITVDDDQVLEGEQSSVNYRATDAVMMEGGVPAVAAVTNPQMDSYLQQIGQGRIMKTATDLAPLDSYTVRVRYADNWWRLYLKKILVGIGILGGILFVSVAIIRWLLTKASLSTARIHPALLIAVSSFLSSFLIIGYTVVVFGMRQWIYQFIPYDSQLMLSILTILISCGVYALLFGCAPIFVGIKRGLAAGVATFASIVGFLIIGSIITLAVLSVNPTYQIDKYPSPLIMERDIPTSSQ